MLVATEETETRVFFVTDGYDEDGEAVNDELFETLEQAKFHASSIAAPRIRICMVRFAYREEDGSWNYDDYLDTFETVMVF
jgi:hypothetical protein